MQFGAMAAIDGNKKKQTIRYLFGNKCLSRLKWAVPSLLHTCIFTAFTFWCKEQKTTTLFFPSSLPVYSSHERRLEQIDPLRFALISERNFKQCSQKKKGEERRQKMKKKSGRRSALEQPCRDACTTRTFVSKHGYCMGMYE